jgi:predicted transcriptional regulator
MAKLKISDQLFERASSAAAQLGYSSVEELVERAIENELKRQQIDQAEQQVADQLRGLGYIE